MEIRTQAWFSAVRYMKEIAFWACTTNIGWKNGLGEKVRSERGGEAL